MVMVPKTKPESFVYTWKSTTIDGTHYSIGIQFFKFFPIESLNIAVESGGCMNGRMRFSCGKQSFIHFQRFRNGGR